MGGLAGLLDRLRPHGVSAQEIRAETWALGGRHHGEALDGARLELAGAGLSPRRAVLLRGVIRSLKRRG